MRLRIYRLCLAALLACGLDACGHEAGPADTGEPEVAWRCEIAQPGTNLVVSSDGTWSFIDHHVNFEEEGIWRVDKAAIVLSTAGGQRTFFLRHEQGVLWRLAYSVGSDPESESEMVAFDEAASRSLLRRLKAGSKSYDER